MLPCLRLFVAVALLFLSWLTAVPALAQTSLSAIPDPKTLGETYVSNPDGVLSAATVQALNARLRPLDQAGLVHIDVVVVRSIGEAVPKEAATQLFNQWKIGDARKDNGLLLLLVLDQRRIEFETGYGLEADLPDAVCYRIQQQYMVPYARQNNYDAAVTQGVAAVVRHLSTQAAQAGDSLAAARYDTLALPDPAPIYADDPAYGSSDALLAQPSAPWWQLPAWLAIVLALLYCGVCLLLWVPLAAAVRGGRGWLAAALAVLGPPLFAVACANASWLQSWPAAVVFWYAALLLNAQVGFWLLARRLRPVLAGASRHRQYTVLQRAHHYLGWTAYLFPLPTLAAYWRRHRQRLTELRDAPYACAHCQQPMHRLAEDHDDAHLQRGQVTEEELRSVDYDVWQCGACQAALTLSYRNLDSNVRPCPQCRYRTLQFDHKQVVQPATRSASGWGWEVHECRSCSHTLQERYTIPQLPPPPSARSSSGSSSSSFSSGSGFSTSSGGSSGGGGAGSSW